MTTEEGELTDRERLAWIESATIEQILQKQRFDPNSSPWVQGEVGKRLGDRLGELRRANPVAFVAASKSIGW